VTWKAGLDIGLKDDAPYRKENLPDSEVEGPEKLAGPGRSPEIPAARDSNVPPTAQPAARKQPRKPGAGG
jgi:hypothetical protein